MLAFTIMFLTLLFLGIAGGFLFGIGYVLYQVAVYYGGLYFNGNQWVPIGIFFLAVWVFRGLKKAVKSLATDC